MQSRILTALALAAVALLLPGAAAAQPKVVVTIKPLYGLVASVMTGVGAPALLVQGSQSPHTYALKPSDARALNAADLFFRVSEQVEPFTARITRSLPGSVAVVTLQDAPGLRLLPQRSGATFEAHSHAHGKPHTHRKAPDGPAIDGHIWLDPDNARVMVDRIEQALVAKDPPRADVYKSNANKLRAELNALATELDGLLRPIKDAPYIVFHDAFQYFEQRFGLKAVGSIAHSPEVSASAKRLTELRGKIAALGVVCVFAEPQFDGRLVANLVEGTRARTGTLDPEGGRLEAGPGLYPTLMRNLAKDLTACLSRPT
jgi:zinc transport system substrate-binding protein